MDSVTLSINITGTHDGVTYNDSGTFIARVRSAAMFSRDLSNSWTVINATGAFNFAIIENTGDEDAFVSWGLFSTGVPAGKAIVIAGSTIEDVSGSKNYGTVVNFSARSRTSAGTRINVVIGI